MSSRLFVFKPTMKAAIGVLLALRLCLPCGAAIIDIDKIDASRIAAARELAEGHFAQARFAYGALLRDIPDHPGIQAPYAASLVGLGRITEAMAVYREILNEGFGAVLRENSAFASLAGRPGYFALKSRVDAQSVPQASAREAFNIPEQRFIAEGLAFEQHSGRFFASSTYLRKIVVRERNGQISDFVPSADHGLLQVLGMKIDSARSRLLVVTATDDARMVDFKPDDLGRSGVFIYDTSSARLIQATWLMAAGKHLFNDLVLDGDGSAYITDSDEGRIYRLSADGKELTPVTIAGALIYPNGIDIEPLRRRLFVADLRGIFTVDIDTGRIERVPQAHGVSTVDLDGLYLHGNDLIGVQSIAKLHRIMSFRLSPDRRRILFAHALDSVDSRLSGPTEGVIVGNELYFIANGFQESVDSDGVIASPSHTAPTPILAVRLSRSPIVTPRTH